MSGKITLQKPQFLQPCGKIIFLCLIYINLNWTPIGLQASKEFFLISIVI